MSEVTHIHKIIPHRPDDLCACEVMLRTIGIDFVKQGTTLVVELTFQNAKELRSVFSGIGEIDDPTEVVAESVEQPFGT